MIHAVKKMGDLYFNNHNTAIASLVVIVMYLTWFSAGLFFGTFIEIPENFVKWAGIMTTSIVFSVGSVIIYNSLFKHHPIIILTTILLMGANIAYSFNLFTASVIDLMFNISTLAVLIVLYQISKRTYFTGFWRE